MAKEEKTADVVEFPKSVISNEALAAIIASLDGIVTFKEPMTPFNCIALIRGMGIDIVNLQRQNIALRAALKEAL